MKPTKLGNLKRNDKFKWNNITYTVYDQEGQMTEVYGNGRFWAWYANIEVTPLSITKW